MSAFSNTGPHPNCAGCRHFRLSRDRTELFWLHKNKARTAETTIRFVDLKAIAYALFLCVRCERRCRAASTVVVQLRVGGDGRAD